LVGLLGAIGFTVALCVAKAVDGYDSIKLGAIAGFLYLENFVRIVIEY